MASDHLRRLVDTLGSSLAMYLSDSGIWSYPGAEPIKLALADLVGDQKSIIERAGVVLEEREVAVPRVAFPIAFTGCHDVDLRFLLPRLIDVLRKQRAEFESIAAAAADDATAAELAGEARRTTERHIGVLEDLAVRLRAGLSGRPAESQTAEPARS